MESSIHFTHKKVVIFFIVYELGRLLLYLNADFALKDCLIVVVKLTRNDGPDEYIHSLIYAHVF